MKKMMLTLIAVFAIAMSSKAMSYEQARNEALFLTDKMAYELNLTDAQYEAAYEINLDYLMGVTSRHDVFGSYWERRNIDLQYILYTWQWEAFRAATYFYRPLYWSTGYWHFGVYARYPHRDYFYFGRPHFYVSYRGGHSWRMNGGHSYYEHHRHHYSPSIAREHHSGMRDGWNRGDYRNHHDNSSTRITGSRNHDHNRPMGVGNAASGNNNTRHGEAGHSESAGHDHNRPFGAGNAATGSSTTSRSENSRISTTGVPNHNQSNRNLRNHNMQNRSAASQMQRSSGFSSPSRSAGVSSPTRSAGVSSPTRSAGVSSPTRSSGMSTSGSRSSVSSHSSSHSSGGATRGGGGGRSGGRR